MQGSQMCVYLCACYLKFDFVFFWFLLLLLEFNSVMLSAYSLSILFFMNTCLSFSKAVRCNDKRPGPVDKCMSSIWNDRANFQHTYKNVPLHDIAW